ncbi:MAG: hypothetical protein IJ514_03030 [Clostridia bacterium]|nr:hypothetical protein [Clostridia bacterium]
MTTSKPFSTISYNSEDFLISKLDELVAGGVLDEYSFIHHAKEEDELKDHIHLYMIPSHKMDTAKIKDYLQEYDEQNPEKPLGCISCVSSKWDDFYLYGIHDPAYLASKGMSRKYRYIKDDFHFSSKEFFYELIRRIDRSKFIGLERITDAVENGVSFAEMARLGQIPVQLVNQYRLMYELMSCDVVNRAGRETHTPKKEKVSKERTYLIDEETGEIIHNPFLTKENKK